MLSSVHGHHHTLHLSQTTTHPSQKASPTYNLILRLEERNLVAHCKKEIYKQTS